MSSWNCISYHTVVVICAGWKCPVCTLVNSPTRPGCAACTTERPLKYVVPVEYHANEQELHRMKQEQQVDHELQQVCSCLHLSIFISSRMCEHCNRYPYDFWCRFHNGYWKIIIKFCVFWECCIQTQCVHELNTGVSVHVVDYCWTETARNRGPASALLTADGSGQHRLGP